MKKLLLISFLFLSFTAGAQITNDSSYLAGRAAAKDFRASSTAIALGTVGGSVLPIGWVWAIPIMYIPPPESSLKLTAEQYKNELYRKGYKKEASKQKRQQVAEGFLWGGAAYMVSRLIVKLSE